MRLKNFLIVVKDIEEAKQFYKELFGLQVLLDQGDNVILTEGLVLQEADDRNRFLGKEVVQRGNSFELYFEEKEIEAFVEKLEGCHPSVEYVTPLTQLDGEQKVVRFYDLDGNLIEVRTPFGLKGYENRPIYVREEYLEYEPSH
jgi:catechol 2,3-dioxygenase-like lactoylglutathione lyase family enzyme